MLRLFNRSDTAPTKHATQSLGVSATIKIPVGVDDGAGAARESREAVELKVTFENDAVGDSASHRPTNVPKCSRPNLTIVVLVSGLAVIERFVSQLQVDPPHTRRIELRHLDPIPGANRSLISSRFLV